ncbi:MAG: type I glyceraldehyde-3-phosphate dehydrogenase [Coxiellaceae bacterium]|jgi:glyceraldehyde 3-phosphate dehydrogenase|nr:type I glyceraldehyde-3-phosphate dehydrogenase [Coxiellaceae bacterium]
MSIKIAINGYGRIGRNVLRAVYEEGYRNDIEVVAVNDLGDAKVNAYLTTYDTVHGKFIGTIETDGDYMIVNGDKIKVLAEKDPSKMPWKNLDVDVVFECTGRFTSKSKAMAHIDAGAKKVMISAPGENVDATVVYGVNHNTLLANHQVISNGSCTTNCLAPVAKVLHEKIGIVSGLMTTIHSYTNDQVLIDVYHKDLRRARSATQSMIPTKTGAASAVGSVLPQLAGKLDGLAVRVPTANVSLVDLVFESMRLSSREEVNLIMKEASLGELKNVLGYNDLPLVSHDFNHNSLSSIFESTQTKVIGKTVKVLSWYDNEWGFSTRMLDVAKFWMQVIN